jgi:catechol 2,3-dioxygenase-like lactoylglutathione lyase family enzyme
MLNHHHLNVTKTDDHRRFFVDTLGGRPVRIGTTPLEVIGFPNALIFLKVQAPSGGTKGTTVNHVAFGVPDIRRMVDRTKAAGYAIVTRAELPDSFEVKDDLCYMSDQGTFVAFTMAPDETKVEFIEIPTQQVPVALHHIHFAAPSVPEMKAWHVAALGATPGKRGNFEAADLPCVNLTYSPAPAPVVGTEGRVLDRIGFDVDGLDAFATRLAGLGVSLHKPVAQMPDLHVRSLSMTDPWGTTIELTEGLRSAW